MRIVARVKPNSKKEAVEMVGEREFAVRVKAPAQGGKANKAAIAILSEYFGVPKSRISILKGQANRNKIIRIADRIFDQRPTQPH